MNILFIHQNFPGQFPHLAAALKERGHKILALTLESNKRPSPVPTVRYRYTEPEWDKVKTRMATTYVGMVHQGEAVLRAANQIKAQNLIDPDVIVAHFGWGESLFLKLVWPNARVLTYAEFFYRPTGLDTGFDPEFARDGILYDANVLARTGHLLLALDQSDQAFAPTQWQASTFPALLQSKIRVLHDGIDTAFAAPNEGASFTLPNGQVLTAADEVLTFSVRNLEPYRGYHIFMRALPAILAARPKAQVVIVGGEGTSYGAKPAEGHTWKSIFLAEVENRIDTARVHFTGTIPHARLIDVFRVSRAHVYLTYPFVLSWSMLESMSAGALLIASRTGPVTEVIRHGENGLLVDFFDVQGLADTVIDALANPADYQHLRAAARDHILSTYDLKTICLPKLVDFVESA